MTVWEGFILQILRWSGITPNGDETDDILPMNPEGVRLMYPKADVYPLKTMFAELPIGKLVETCTHELKISMK